MGTTPLRWLCGASLGVALAMVLVAAQDRDDSLRALQAELRAAVYTALVDGDLHAAIAQYARIVARANSHRAIAAEALLRMAQAYEMLGMPEARQAYARLTREYGDQAEAAQAARTRLAAIDEAAARDIGRESSPTLTLVLNEAMASRVNKLAVSYDFSPNGDRIVFLGPWDENVDPARRGPGARNGTQNVALYVADGAGALIRPLLIDWGPLTSRLTPPNVPGSIERIDHLRWSPDGKWIAFAALRPSDDYPYRLADVPRERLPEARQQAYVPVIFVVDAEGGSPRQIAGVPPAGRGGLLDLWWSHDGGHLAYVTQDGIYTLTLDGRASRVIEMQAQSNLRVGGYSPDGRWLAFVRGNFRQEGFRLFVVPANGGRAIEQAHVVQPRLRNLRNLRPSSGLQAGSALRPAWAHDGRALYVMSDVSRTANIWRVPFNPETGLPDGRPEQVTFYTDGWPQAPKVPRAGSLAFTLMRQTSTVNLARADRPDEVHVVARGHTPKLAPDGRTVYYLGEGPEQEGILAVSRSGGTPRRVTSDWVPAGDFGDGFAVSPDGETLAYRTEDETAQHLYAVPATGGEPRRLHTFASDVEAGGPSFAPDGSAVAYTEGNELFTVSPRGGAATKVAHLWALDGWSIRWSPDGRWLAALGWESPAARENSVFVVAASGGEPRRLTPISGSGLAYLEGLEWHPDGRRLSYFDYRVEMNLTVDLTGRVSPPLFDQHDGWEYVGKWEPDGHRFFFTSFHYSEPPGRTYVFDPASGDIRRALATADDGVEQSLPDWSRDGTTIVWSAVRRVRQIWLMDRAR